MCVYFLVVYIQTLKCSVDLIWNFKNWYSIEFILFAINQKKNNWKYTVSVLCKFVIKFNKQKTFWTMWFYLVLNSSCEHILVSLSKSRHQSISKLAGTFEVSGFSLGGFTLPESINWAKEVDLFSNFSVSSRNPTLPMQRLWGSLQSFEITSIPWGHSSETTFLGVRTLYSVSWYLVFLAFGAPMLHVLFLGCFGKRVRQQEHPNTNTRVYWLALPLLDNFPVKWFLKELHRGHWKTKPKTKKSLHGKEAP